LRPLRSGAAGHQTQQTIPNNLPRDMTSFVGRDTEIGEVAGLLTGARIVTLTGPGGIGKTRLALRVAGEVLPVYPDGVWLVELASISDPGLVARTVAEVLGVREDGGSSPLDALALWLERRRTLIVLDNC